MKTSQLVPLSSILSAALVTFVLAQEKSRQDNRGKPVTTAAQVSTRTNLPASSDFPVIGYLEKRDGTITIKAGPGGPLYSVKTAAGNVLCENVPLEELRDEAPELHQFIKSALAGSSKGGAVVDASLRLR